MTPNKPYEIVRVVARSEQNDVDAALNGVLGVDGGGEDDDAPEAPEFDDAGIEP